MPEEQRIQWHPAFCSAVELELLANKADLEYHREYNLSSKPFQMDLLVIEKEAGVTIKNELGAIFRKYNIFEYKGPNDQLNVDILYKVLGYACLYKGLGQSVNFISGKELTVTLVRWSVPKELFKILRLDGYTVEKAYEGIYYIKGIIDMPIQVVVIREVLGDKHKSLKMLSDKLTAQEARCFIEEFVGLTEQGDRNNVDAVLQVGASANRMVFYKLRSETKMCEALRELMKEDLAMAEAKGEAIGKDKGEIIGKIKNIIDFVLDGTISVEKGAEKANLSVAAFKKLMEEYKASGKIVLE